MRVTAEVTPHHLSLTDERLRGFDPVFKVNPPLRTKADIEALVEGVVDGTIDAIATDHAPHPADAKERPLDEAPPGMLGLETALGVCLPILRSAGMSVADVVAALHVEAGGDRRHRRPPRRTDRDRVARRTSSCSTPDESWEVVPAKLASRSRNTPFAGVELRGRVRHTVLAGVPTVVDGVACR